MASFIGLGIVLSFVFGCILLGLVAQLYYLLWWKKKNRNAAGVGGEISDQFFQKNPAGKAQQFTYLGNPDANGDEPDLELGSAKDPPSSKGFDDGPFDDGGVESELMRQHNLCGPPKFLFPISEETKEDLDSDDGKSRGGRSRKGSRTRSLSTEWASPNFNGSPLESYNVHGFNPLFESSTDSGVFMVRSSPPPKFKFLRDAEEKLLRRLMEEKAERTAFKNGGVCSGLLCQSSTQFSNGGKRGKW
ncbi:hypothetical protein U1Q18_020873 [Sarracenia purpurea var. burkii]